MRFTLLLSSLFLVLNVFAQNSRVTIKVIDAVSGINVESAVVEVEQLPGVIYQTDDSGLVIFNSVPQGRITIRVIANGYLPFKDNYSHVSQETKNNYYEVRLARTATETEYLFFGEISDMNGDDIENAKVEIKILDKTYTSYSNNSGDYSIRVPSSVAKGVRYYKIEVTSPNCTEKFEERRDLPSHPNVENEIEISCNSTQQDVKSEFEYDNLRISIKSCEQQGQFMRCDFEMISMGMDEEIRLYNHNKSILLYDQYGNEYEALDMEIGGVKDTYRVTKNLIKDLGIPGWVRFENVKIDVTRVTKITMSIGREDGGYINPEFDGFKIN